MNLALHLDRASAVPLQDQLFEQLRLMIVSARLKPNSRVIATRFLAEQVGVSRTTVLLAYERLIAEGYLETRPAIGTFVAASLPDSAGQELAPDHASDLPRQSVLHPAMLDEDFAAQARLWGTAGEGAIDFTPAHSDASNLVSPKIWLRTLRDIVEREPDGLADAQLAGGVPALRRTLSDYLASTRGLMLSPEQVVVVSGRRQACGLTAHLFQRPGDKVVLESPCDPAIAAFFKARHAEIVPVPVDEDGLITDSLPAGNVALAYVTPARQNPIGGVLPLARRKVLIEWARQSGAYIIEDDSVGDLRYQGTSPPPLAALDPYGLVFHVGSFAATLGAGLGIGHLVVPGEFVGDMQAIKAMLEVNCSWLDQMFVRELIVSGEYDHHLRRLRKTYMERRDCLVGALKAQFGQVRLIGLESGTQLTWMLPEGMPQAAVVCEKASRNGVVLGRVAPKDLPSTSEALFQDRALIMSFAALASARLLDGIGALAAALAG